MKQWVSILWKEWHEARVFLLIGLFVFLGLPLIGGLEQKLHTPFFEVMAGLWVFVLGGVFAVFVGVAVGGRDLRGQLEDFWRSRPMNVLPWFAAKWAVGLLVVLASLIVPLAVQAIVTPNFDSPEPVGVLLAWNPFLWAALYSLAFLVAALVRRGANATMLALSLLLLVYFLPFVLPPLQRSGIFWVMGDSSNPRQTPAGKLLPDYRQVPWVPWHVLYEPQQLTFIAAMVGLSMVALIVAILAVRRGWRIESGKRMLYWSVGSALLILFASAAFQLATNLPVIHEVAIQPDERVERIVSDGSRGVVFTAGIYDVGIKRAYPIRIAAGDLELGPGVSIDPNTWQAVWSPQHPDFFFCLHFPRTPQGQEPVLELLRVRLNAPQADQPEQVVFKSKVVWGELAGNVYEIDDHLYLPAKKVLMFDVSNPLAPKMDSIDWPGAHFSRPASDEEGPGIVLIPLLQIPGFSPRQRLEMRLSGYGESAFEGDILARANSNRLTTYRLSKLTPEFARFDHVGAYSAPLLEQLFGGSRAVCSMGNGLVYASILPNHSSIFNGSRITVFDVRNPAQPRPVGHFAVPNARLDLVSCPLPGGRALIGGDRVYLVGLPPRL